LHDNFSSTIMRKKFSWKSFISFGLFFFFIVILTSGVILYISPPGRIANWTDWDLIGLTKLQWQTIHTNFSYLFAILSIIHLFTLNWKIFWSYIKSKARSGLNKKLELLLASVFTLVVFTGVFFGFPPFSSVMELGENFREGWEKDIEAPPVPHTEEFSIARLSGEILKIPDTVLISKLGKLGIEVMNNDQTLKDLAIQVALSPNEIYRELTTGSHLPGGKVQPGGGLGRKSLRMIAAENDLILDEMLLLLEHEGIQATGVEIIRDLAQQYKISPSEILAILNGGDRSH
jgi:hypothetical protein